MFTEWSARAGHGSSALREAVVAYTLRYPWICKMRCPAAGLALNNLRRRKSFGRPEDGPKGPARKCRLTIEATDTLMAPSKTRCCQNLAKFACPGPVRHLSTARTRRRSAAPTTASASAREERGLSRPGARAPSAEHTDPTTKNQKPESHLTPIMKNKAQRKYSGAGLFCGTPLDSCGAASNIRYVLASSPSSSRIAATFPQR